MINEDKRERRRRLRHVLADGARRHPKPELQQQLVCDPLLAPSRVVTRHPSNQLLEFGRYRTPTSSGLTAPEKAEAPAVPGDEGPGPYNNQSISPIEPAAEQHQREPRRIVGTPGLNLALLIEGELLAQKQILGRERSPGAQAETRKLEQITQNPQPTQPCPHRA